MSDHEDPTHGNPYATRIRRVLLHVQEHLDDELPLARLAAVADLSPFHFHRIFRGLVGETVAAYVRRLRLERAAHFLRRSDRPVIELAFQAGYETQESFTRAFGSAFGIPPARYRKQHRELPRLASPSGAHFELDPELVSFTPQIEETPMDVTIETLPKQQVVALRHVGPYQECASAWAQLCGFAGPRGLFGPSTTMLGLAYDDPQVVPADKLRYDACFTVDHAPELPEPFDLKEIGGQEYAVAMHKGSYARLHESYEAVCGQWLPQSGRTVTSDACIEFYLNDPQSTPEDELLTKICIPLAPR